MLPLKFRDEIRRKAVVRIRNAASAFGERNERRFTVKTVDNGAIVKRVA